MRDPNFKSVCFGCKKRAAGCGATCKEYKAERNARMKEYKQKREASKVTSASIEIRGGKKTK